MSEMTQYNEALFNLYKQVGFIPDWVVCPIDDCTGNYWDVDDIECKYADSVEQFNSDGDYYLDEIYKQRHYTKWVYEGEKLTMVMCDPHVDGAQWFRIFDNSKRLNK
tara:strand:- start:29 stop:349 length:321 start_codon:yes stop_codon:yes gene_type:complete